MHGSASGAIDSIGLFRADFLIQIIHQSFVFCDKLWASFSLAALDFEQSLYQLRKLCHIHRQWLVANTIGENRGQNCSKLLTSSLRRPTGLARLVVILP